ncbi:hypothetical protein HYH03_014542 [Edaphochlamys debaryana]|uniref:Uncharacterized protein n=1 Tax=Edaphochlamys debaryana TaxID=47281 RepID=A0A835XW19_9CHLO|nr:hypothetical protein HYH03_014542 [Edaphochlamys debaryana]|eukprot:KAG2486859.1 hypothetical protein HYH03_014542 [Edaphochlamys debaryana]
MPQAPGPASQGPAWSGSGSEAAESRGSGDDGCDCGECGDCGDDGGSHSDPSFGHALGSSRVASLQAAAHAALTGPREALAAGQVEALAVVLVPRGEASSGPERVPSAEPPALQGTAFACPHIPSSEVAGCLGDGHGGGAAGSFGECGSSDFSSGAANGGRRSSGSRLKRQLSGVSTSTQHHLGPRPGPPFTPALATHYYNAYATAAATTNDNASAFPGNTVTATPTAAVPASAGYLPAMPDAAAPLSSKLGRFLRATLPGPLPRQSRPWGGPQLDARLEGELAELLQGLGPSTGPREAQSGPVAAALSSASAGAAGEWLPPPACHSRPKLEALNASTGCAHEMQQSGRGVVSSSDEPYVSSRPASLTYGTGPRWPGSVNGPCGPAFLSRVCSLPRCATSLCPPFALHTIACPN